MKISVSKESLTTRTPDFRTLQSNISAKNEFFFAYSYGAQVKSLKQKNGWKSRDTVP